MRAHVVAGIAILGLLLFGIFVGLHPSSVAAAASTSLGLTSPAASTTSLASSAPQQPGTHPTMHPLSLHDIWLLDARKNCDYNQNSWDWWQKNKPANNTAKEYASACPGKTYAKLKVLFAPAPAITHPAHAIASAPASPDTLIYNGVNCLDPNLISAHNPCMFHDRGPQPVDPNYEGECQLAQHMARDTHLSLQRYFRENYPQAIGNCPGYN